MITSSINIKDLESTFSALSLDVKISHFPASHPSNVCNIWRSLASDAYQNGCTYFLLYGDDVDVVSGCNDWPYKVHECFQELKGFGCVALKDISSPGFPTFPIVSRIHMQIFGGEVIPPEFINQDGDPYIWELYRRWGHSRFVDVQIKNKFGGAQIVDDSSYVKPRYLRQHINWKDDILFRGITKIRNWLKDNNFSGCFNEKLVIDVIIPTFRVNREFLERILDIDIPSKCDTMFLVIVDNPRADISWLRNLEKSNRYFGRLRVRVHETIMGASEARNTGLKESSADWVLFLDDDLKPERDILHPYMNEIFLNGHKYHGFGGYTILPLDDRIFTAAVHLSDVSYFWTIADKFEESPWYITANLVVRHRGIPENRDNATISNCDDPKDEYCNDYRKIVLFDPEFIKTGGGEDIDYCLRLQLRPIRTVPAAKCIHPWWDGGNRCYIHFFKWAYGDSLLMKKYKHLTYYNYPNAIELILLFALLSLFSKSQIFVFKCIIDIIGILLVDIVLDIFHNFVDKDRRKLQSQCQGGSRIQACIESNIIKNMSNIGHIIGPLFRDYSLPIFLRFDWFCGLHPNIIVSERNKACLRFLLFATFIALNHVRLKAL